MSRFRQFSFWVVVFAAVGSIAGFSAGGFALGQWWARMSVVEANKDKDKANDERNKLIARFPIVRKESYDAGVASSAAKIASLQKQIEDFGDMKAMIAETHELSAYTLRFLGDRAKINDQRTAAMLKQSKVAAAAAVDAKQTVEKVDQKVNVAVVKADEAASAVKSVGKKLETATHPTAAVPPTPWAGNRR